MKKEFNFYHVQWTWQKEEDATLEISNGLKHDNTEYRTFLGTGFIDIPENIKPLSHEQKKSNLIDIFKKEKQLIIANHVVELNKIEDKIQQLLSIEYKD